MIEGVDCCRAARLAGSVSLADQAWALLVQVAFERVHAHFAAIVAELDLAPVQAKALHELNLEPPISMRELAERLRSDPSNVTGLIDRLEARGLVERRPDPNDRRIKGLALTPSGAGLRERLFARLYLAPPALAALSEREQGCLRDALQHVLSGAMEPVVGAPVDNA
jgi:DNA-binding MarR family transcriptional regulator